MRERERERERAGQLLYTNGTFYRKEERTGLNSVPSPLTLSKGGQRHSESIRGLSDCGGDLRG